MRLPGMLPLCSVLAAGAIASAGRPLLGEEARQGPTPEEQQIVAAINEQRAKQGLQALTLDPLLVEVARAHSAEMRDCGYFGHRSPTPGRRTLMDRYLGAVNPRPSQAVLGESLYFGPALTPEALVKTLLERRTDRENILFARFERAGAGVVRNERGQVSVTTMFLTTRRYDQIADQE